MYAHQEQIAVADYNYKGMKITGRKPLFYYTQNLNRAGARYSFSTNDNDWLIL